MTRGGSAERQGPTTRLSRSAVLTAARRHYVNGETQTAIAADMGVSSSYLTKLLKQALAKGWVRIIVDTDQEEELAADLLSAFPSLVHAVVVPDAPQDLPPARRADLMATQLGTAAALWLDDLITRDDEDDAPQIWRVAVGGSVVTHKMIERLSARSNRISVGPTAITPQIGKATRFTASDLAYQLAAKWGALTPGERVENDVERTGYLYRASLEPPTNSLDALRDYYARLEQHPGYAELQDFWSKVDIAFISAVPTSWRYSDVPRRLEALGLSLAEMEERGAVVIAANRFLNASCVEVPLAVATSSYELVMSTADLKGIRNRHSPRSPRRGLIVLDAWGEPGVAADVLLRDGIVNVLLCDRRTAAYLVANIPGKSRG